MNYRFAYRGVGKAALIVDTPGPTPPHVRGLPYRRMQRPFFLHDDRAGEARWSPDRAIVDRPSGAG